MNLRNLPFLSSQNTFSSHAPPLLTLCRDAIAAEAEALTRYAEKIDENFLKALSLLNSAQSPIIVAGIGKSGHIARKIASTFSSIGKPAVFMHAAEASHGDLGLLSKDSVVLILSNSGETPELSDLLCYCKEHQIPTVAITAKHTTALGRSATVTLAYGHVEEVCPNGLAPTTSTTLTLAIGDALAVGLTDLIGTAPEDFRRYHPGGKLGSKLVRVEDLMHKGNALPIVSPEMPMSEVVVVMSEKGFGIAVIVENNRIQAIITDGDMRRNINQLWDSAAADIGSTNPTIITKEVSAEKAVEIMTNLSITCCLVEDEGGQFLGLIHIHDCLRAGVSEGREKIPDKVYRLDK